MVTPDRARAEAILSRRRAGASDRTAELADSEPVIAEQLDGLTSAQARMWFMQRLDPGSGEYNIGSEIHCVGELDQRRLVYALASVVRRHENLRSSFPAAPDGSPTRTVRAHADLDIDLEIVTLLSGTSDPETAEEVAVRVRRPFDLATGPLYRFSVLRCADGVDVLLLVFHHIVCDGWSIRLVYRDLSAAYNDESESPLPRLRPADLVRREADYLRGRQARRDLDWWVEQLADAPATPAPLSRRRETGKPGGLTTGLMLPEDVTLDLERLARDTSSSLYTVVAAAVAAWMSRATGEPDIVFGSPVAERGDDGVAELVGLAVNTVVMRARPDPAGSVAELVQHLRSVILAGLEHRRLPFDRVVDRLRPSRAVRENPLFDVMVAHQNVPSEAPALEGVRTSVKTAAAAQVRVPLEITTWRRTDGLELRVGVRTDRYTATVADRIAQQLSTVLRGMADQPAATLAELDVLPAEEAACLDAWERGPEAPPSRLTTLHGLLREQARRSPNAHAVHSRDETWTFDTLQKKADRLTAALRARGIGLGDVVGIALQRGCSLVAAVLGVLATGAAFVPLNMRDPESRRVYMLADAGARAVVVEESGEWVTDDIETVPWGTVQANPETPPEDGPAGPDDLAYIMYTSGTSGRPKGVQVAHRNVVNTLLECMETDAFGPGDLGLVTAANTFDVFYHELFSTMIGGGASYVVTHDELYDVEAMSGLLGRATTFQAVPGLMDHLLRILDTAGAGPVTGVRRVMTGGDAVPAGLLTAVAQAFPNARISITYGPTETAIFATRHVVDPARPVAGCPIGRPAGGVHVRVADDVGRPLPIGADGEIWIGGNGVGLGYRNRPPEQQTAFALHEGGLWYRTGDRGRWLTDGTLEFLGRRDNQVKVRGVRIELGEIEAVAAQSPGVARAIAVAAGESPAHRRLDLFIVPDGRAGADGHARSQVRRWQELFDQTYGSRVHNVLGHNDFTGWHSSFDGHPYPPEVMLDWQQASLRRLRQAMRNHGTPERPSIAEAGCGTGLMLLELAPEARAYHAGDISERAVSDLAERVAQLGLGHVSLTVGDATELAAPQPVDVVVLNSVVQYLPSAQHLEQVLDRALELLDPGGFVFIGDVRNLASCEEFHREVAKARGIPSDEQEAWARERMRTEEELLLDPAWFDDFCDSRGGGLVAALSRRLDRFDTEMSRFRYDVVLGRKAVHDRTSDVPSAHADGASRYNQPMRQTQERALAAEVRGRISAMLPEYMVPSSITLLDRVPTTPNGKLDRAALPAPRYHAAEAERSHSPAESAVRQAWISVLGHGDFGLHSDFFEVGGTSLLAVRLAAALRPLRKDFGPQEVFEARTVAVMATAAEHVSAHPDGPADETTLPGTSVPASAPARPLLGEGEVLLTGATGMLGVHLLHELLTRGDGLVRCLVRAGHASWAISRLRDQFAWYFPGSPTLAEFDRRVEALAGDLTQDRLGLSADLWQHLAGSLSHIVHCGADVRHVADRDEVFAVNLRGTREVVRLARAGSSIALHHVSTVGVAGRTPIGFNGTAPEIDEQTLHVGQVPTEAYSESKILAEDLVRRHLREGFSGSVIRVGTVAPSRTGRFQRNIDGHFFNRFLRSTLLAGFVADWPDRAFRLVPVDVMAAAVVGLADANAAPYGAFFHVEGPQPVTHRELAALLTDIGYTTAVLAPDQYPQAVDRQISEAGPDVVTGLVPLLATRSGVPIRLNSQHSHRALAELGVRIPELEREWLCRMLAEGARRGYLPQPSETASTADLGEGATS